VSSSASEREQWLAWVFNTQDQGAVLLDGARRVLDANPAACALLDGGVPREALLGTTLPDPPLVSESVRVETYVRADGGALVTLSDVEREVRARHAVERIAGAVEEFLFTAELLGSGQLSMVYTSPGIERLLGGEIPAGRSVEAAWFGAIHPEDREAARDTLRAAAAGRPSTVEYRLVGVDGRVRWVRSRTQRREESGRVLYDGIASDVTAQRIGDEEMARFRGVVEASGSAIALLDLDWRVRWMNPAGLAMTGLSAADAVGTAYLELVGHEARALHLDVERPTVERDGRWSGESVLLPAGGGPGRRTLPVDATTYRIEHPATGEPLGLACIRRDVSDLKQMAREHAAIGNLASTIATGAGRDDIYEAACREAAHLLGADAGGIAMLSGGTTGAGPRTVGTWRKPGADDRLELAIGRLGAPAAPGGPAAAAAAFVGMGALELDGGHHAVGAPVMVDGRAWGLIAACRRGAAFGGEDERALARLGSLVGTAVGVATSRELLVRQATTDGLTGLCNHRSFHDTLRAEAGRAARYGRPLAVVLADLDGFKEVNDAHGHQTGDRLLEAVARALEGVVRSTEVVARLGGDEFALLLPETGVVGARATAERVRATVAALPREVAFGVSVSSGVADLEQAGGSADELIRLADGALYWSKVHGRDRVSVYDPDRVEALSGAERAERLASGGRSAEVAALAARLAGALRDLPPEADLAATIERVLTGGSDVPLE
jgi:diguanylate cyclase (GGDEF)-like protein/PAS domain S-box-containing protein